MRYLPVLETLIPAVSNNSWSCLETLRLVLRPATGLTIKRTLCTNVSIAETLSMSLEHRCNLPLDPTASITRKGQVNSPKRCFLGLVFLEAFSRTRCFCILILSLGAKFSLANNETSDKVADPCGTKNIVPGKLLDAVFKGNDD